MKKNLNLLLAAVLILGLCGCTQPEPPESSEPAVTVSTGTMETIALPEMTAPQTEPEETGEATEPSMVTEPTEATEATESLQQDKPKDPPATEPTQPATDPTDPPSTTPAETEPIETQPPETEPVETEPPATEPPTTQPSEPTGCQHDWECIHHAEVGHWRAGIVCDCGWTVYGDPDELVALWNAHSASYPPSESLFDHGGYGSADEWTVDTPAYDEWVCRHCGEPKP